eukprot:1471757-Pyramimonas_sp.AAC.1
MHRLWGGTNYMSLDSPRDNAGTSKHILLQSLRHAATLGKGNHIVLHCARRVGAPAGPTIPSGVRDPV